MEKIRTGEKAKTEQIKTDREPKEEEGVSMLKKERDQFKLEVLQLKQEISELSSNLADKEQTLLSTTKNYNLLKTKT